MARCTEYKWPFVSSEIYFRIILPQSLASYKFVFLFSSFNLEQLTFYMAQLNSYILLPRFPCITNIKVNDILSENLLYAEASRYTFQLWGNELRIMTITKIECWYMKSCNKRWPITLSHKGRASYYIMKECLKI